MDQIILRWVGHVDGMDEYRLVLMSGKEVEYRYGVDRGYVGCMV